jgi:transposase
MLSREDIEKLDVEAASDSPSTRSLLLMFKALVLQLMNLIEELRLGLKARESENAELKTYIFGQRSERQKRTQRLPSAPLDPRESAARQREGQKKRRANRDAKEETATEDVEHPVPEQCPSCGRQGPFPALPPELSYQFEFVPARVIRHRHVRYKAACACGQILCGTPPVRVGDCAHYGPRLHAHAVVSKCADAMPLNRTCPDSPVRRLAGPRGRLRPMLGETVLSSALALGGTGGAGRRPSAVAMAARSVRRSPVHGEQLVDR